MKIDIRTMTQQDLNNISSNLEKNFDDFWNFNIFKAEIANTNSSYIVAIENNEIVGFAGFSLVLEEADITNIVTRKDKRNLGIASMMLDALLQLAKDKNTKTITLEVNTNNAYAIQLYEKFYFKKVGLRKKYYHHCEDAIIMTLSF